MTYINKRPTRDDYEKLVNRKWENVPYENKHPQSGEEAIKGFKILYLKATGRKFVGKIKITSGNRHNWCSSGEWSINPSRGWEDIIHSISHWVMGNHSQEQLYLERDLTDYALKREFHKGRLAPKKVVKRKRRMTASEKRARAEQNANARNRRAAKKLAAELNIKIDTNPHGAGRLGGHGEWEGWVLDDRLEGDQYCLDWEDVLDKLKELRNETVTI